MAHVIIKSDSRRQQEAAVLRDFAGNRRPSAADRDAAQVIAARTRETYQQLKRMEGKKR